MRSRECDCIAEKWAVTLEIPELIQFLVQELHDLPDDRKPGNNTKYQVEDAVELLQINYML